MSSSVPSGQSKSSPTSSSSQQAKPFSLSLGGSKPKPLPLSQKPLTPSNGTKRPHSSLNDSDDDGDISPQAQLVLAFDHSAGGAISVNGLGGGKAPLIIQGQRNRDWREESRRKRGRNLLPAEVQAARATGGVTDGQEVKDVVNGGPQAFGLSFVKEGNVVTKVEDDPKQVQDLWLAPKVEPERQKTDDELALEALTSDGTTRKSTLVLPALHTEQEVQDIWGGRATNGMNEDDAFKLDVASRPDAATLDDYAAVPVEEFGAALLRGMGWKEGDVVGKRKDQISKPRTVERRPALLGIGAKEMPGGVGDELGAWGKAVKGKRKVDKTYNPVLLRNAKTGEMLTEEELKAKVEEQKKEEEDRRDRKLAVDKDKNAGGSRERDRERYRDSRHIQDSSHGSNRHNSSWRDRSQSPDRKHRRKDAHRYDPKARNHKRRDKDGEYYESSSSRRDRSPSSDKKSRRRDEDGYDRKERDRTLRDENHDDYPSSSSRRIRRENNTQYEDSSRRRRHESIRV
ncbi:MAG: hypothetical protein M1827_000764 [Pycnora praestabilis]|nr:MAG: hypothetical protein M1827_000764 [Pycnora praestabilis]